MLFDPTENCLFLTGGRKLNADPDNENSVLKIEKKGAVVELNLQMVFNSLEAQGAVKNFDELGVTKEEVRTKFSNLVFLEAYENKQTPKKISIIDPSFVVMYDKEDKATIVITGVIADAGKTDHFKTDHGNLGN